MSEHTPGPWSLWHNDAGAFMAIAPGGNGAPVICQRADWSHNASESIANARLIVAAPALLQALEHLTSAVEREEVQVFHLRHARAAIAEAKGGTS